MTNHPRHPDQLPGTKWTSAAGLRRYRHWEVAAVRTKTATVELRATLDRSHTIVIEWRELRDRARWTPGWISTR